MLTFFKLILSFAPWLSFLFIAHGSMFRLKLGIVVALALSVAMGFARLHRGIILWTGLIFFVYALVAVVFYENMWTVRYMGVLANGALALGTWVTVLVKKPFTMDYAKAHTDPSRWTHPLFIRSNYIITSVWGLAFTINASLAATGVLAPDFPTLTRELLSYACLVSAAVFTTWYPAAVARSRTEEPPGTSGNAS